MITEVTCVWARMAEFNDRWTKENLPYWEANGARHIGSYENYLGGEKNKTVRLFEFDSLDAYNVFMARREEMFDTEDGEAAMQRLYPYLETIRETAWKSA